MKKYILLGAFTFVALIGLMLINDYVLFPGITTESLLESKTFFSVIKVAFIEAVIGTTVTWVIGWLFFSEKDADN